jgi:hypothetical protein
VTELEALQAALAGEHAAVWARELAGGVLAATDPGAAEAARAAVAAHRARRDALAELLVRRGAEPVAARPAYGLPFPLADAAAAQRLAATVEDRLAAVYADLVAASTGQPRAVGAAGLLAAATATIAAGGPAAAFPGLPERA